MKDKTNQANNAHDNLIIRAYVDMGELKYKKIPQMRNDEGYAKR